MSNYYATVSWQRAGADFLNKKYSREHQWLFESGTRVEASASHHIVPQPWSNPDFVDPEEAFVASLASCHMLFFLDLAAQGGFVVENYEDAACGILGKGGNGAMMVTEVTLNPQAWFSGENQPAEAEIEALHHRAHELCFIANSVTTEVRIIPR